MATRGSIPKMMEAGRHRHAAARSGRSLDPSRTDQRRHARRSRRRPALGRAAERVGCDRRPRHRCALQASHRDASGARPDGRQDHRHGPLQRPDDGDHSRSDGPAVPERSSHRRHAGAARRDGHRGICRSCAVRASGLAHRGHRGSELPGAVQVLPGRATNGDHRGVLLSAGRQAWSPIAV